MNTDTETVQMGNNVAGTWILREALWEKTIFFLDVEAGSLHQLLEPIMEEISNQLNLQEGERNLIRKSLSSLFSKGPTTIENGAALLNKAISSLRAPIQILIRFKDPINLVDSEVIKTRFAWILLSETKSHPFISNVAEFFQLMNYKWFRRRAAKEETKEGLVNLYVEGLDRALNFQLRGDENAEIKGAFSGIRSDVKRRASFWLSDFKSGLNLKVVASILFMFFACAAPAVAFGALVDNLTEGNIGVIETILSTVVCGLIWTFIGGQPLIILGATGPSIIFTGILYQLTKHYNVPFLSTFFWVGMWTMVFMCLLAVFNVSKLMRFFTRFTDETFASLIALIYITESIKDVSRILADPNIPNDTGLLSLLLAFGTFCIAYILSRFRKTPYLHHSVREFLSDFGPAIAIIFMTFLTLKFPSVTLETLNVPESFRATAERSWFIDPFLAPSWVYFGAALPAALLTILIWINQNIVGRLVNSPDHNLKKGTSFHWDIFIVGLLIGLSSCFGLPWLVGSTAVSINHVRSLAIVKSGKIVKTIETRLSNFGVNLLLTSSLFALHLLKLIPISVLYGMFFFMGVAIFAGNQFIERLRMWFIDPSLLKPTHHFRAVPARTKHLFTGIQFVCLGTLWLIKESFIGILFPFFVALLVPVRMLLGKIFEPEYVALLDLEESPEKFVDISS